MEVQSRILVALLASGIVLAGVQAAAQDRDNVPRSAERVISAEARPLSLEEALDFGLQISLRIRRAARNEESAVLREKNAEAQRWPRFDLAANANDSLSQTSWRTPSNVGNTSPEQRVQTGITAIVSLPIDVSGVYQRQIDQARISRESIGLYREQAEIDVMVEIRAAYVEALRLQDALEAEETIVNDLERLIAELRKRRPAAVPFFELELANARQSLVQARSEADLGQTGIKQALRLNPNERLRLTTKLSTDVPAVDTATLLDKALEQRVEMRDMDLRRRQAELNIEQVKDYRRPSLNFFTYYTNYWYGSQFSNAGESNGSVAAFQLNLYVPLAMWDGGTLRNNERSAVLNLEQIKDDLTEQKERIGLELKQLTVGLEQARRRLSALPSETLARESLRAAEQSVIDSEDWQANLAQVSNARNVWRLARTATIGALADYYSAYYRLKRAVGER